MRKIMLLPPLPPQLSKGHTEIDMRNGNYLFQDFRKMVRGDRKYF